MLEQEAAWLESAIRRIGPQRLSPMLNIGSGSEDFRTRQQPRVERVLGSLAEAGGLVINTDIRNSVGVDVVGDLMDPAFASSLKDLRISSVLCTNVLEHVADPKVVAATLVDLVPQGGYLILSVPYRYPYHADPIDNRFRPAPEDIVRMLDQLEVEAAAEVRCGTFAEGLRRDPRGALFWLLRLLVPVYRMRGWLTAAAKLPWLFREYTVTCVVLRKPGSPQPAAGWPAARW